MPQAVFEPDTAEVLNISTYKQVWLVEMCTFY